VFFKADDGHMTLLWKTLIIVKNTFEIPYLSVLLPSAHFTTYHLDLC
jgi:hypothetical protein